MNTNDRIKLFQDVFAPQPGENVLFLIDVPHGKILDSESWKLRREMAHDWLDTFQSMQISGGLNVNWLEYNATGVHNSPIPNHVLCAAQKAHLVIAMTEYSASSSLFPLVRKKDSITRAASMAKVERRSEETALRADYKEIQHYTRVLKQMLDGAIGAHVRFSTGDSLYIDLRNRFAFEDKGDCTQKGQFINLPSGECCIAPYEAYGEEQKIFGRSKTEGIWPVNLDGEFFKFLVKNNRITEVIGKGLKASELRRYFSENNTRANVSELGIGCNSYAVVTGNPLEDEKAGLHIAYGMSTHIGGKNMSDVHYDLMYVNGCTIEGQLVTLEAKDGSKIDIVTNGTVQYKLLKKNLIK